MNSTNSPHQPPPSGNQTPRIGARPALRRPTPDGFEQRLLARARAVGLGPGDRVLVGFSGGRDSLALAAALRRVAAVLGNEPFLLHVDHRLRSSSGADALAAAELARALGLELRIVEVSDELLSLHPGVGVEEAARRERYRLLAAAAAERGAWVAVAHHQGDQAETVLLHLLRGGGVHGAAAMGEWSPYPTHAPATAKDISQENPAISLWRPLLTETRAAIEAYVERLGLTPIEDPSNADRGLRRNALRHEALPLLERHVPGATAALARYASLAAEDDRLLEALADQALREAVDPGGRLISARLETQPLALQRRMVRKWLEQATGSTSFTAERTGAILALASPAQAGAAIEVGEGWTVRRERGMLRVQRHEDETTAGERRAGEGG